MPKNPGKTPFATTSQTSMFWSFTKKSSIMLNVVWAEESKKVMTTSQFVSEGKSSCNTKTSFLFLLDKWTQMTLFRIDRSKDLFSFLLKKNRPVCPFLFLSSECVCRRMLYVCIIWSASMKIVRGQLRCQLFVVMSLIDNTILHTTRRSVSAP